MRLFLDLFSGYGGASQAFVNDPTWRVMRIENNPLLEDVPHTRLMDVKCPSLFRTILEEKPDVIWASPPCREFSTCMNMLPGGKPSNPDLGLVLHAKRLMELQPDCIWVIENVHGAIPHFKNRLGDPRQKVGPFMLWGNFPLLHVGPHFKHDKMAGDPHSSDPLRSNHRAIIPYSVSDALRRSLIEQRTLTIY